MGASISCRVPRLYAWTNRDRTRRIPRRSHAFRYEGEARPASNNVRAALLSPRFCHLPRQKHAYAARGIRRAAVSWYISSLVHNDFRVAEECLQNRCTVCFQRRMLRNVALPAHRAIQKHAPCSHSVPIPRMSVAAFRWCSGTCIYRFSQ